MFSNHPINLLPLEEKKNVRRLYVVRLFIVTAVLVSITGTLSTAFLVPAYILLTVKERRLQGDVLMLSGGGVGPVDQETEMLVKETNDLITIFSTRNDQLSRVITALRAKEGDGVAITGYFFQKKGAETGETRVEFSLRGVAATRSALVAFEDRLKDDTYFTSIELPVSDFARSRDITFSITGLVAYAP